MFVLKNNKYKISINWWKTKEYNIFANKKCKIYVVM